MASRSVKTDLQLIEEAFEAVKTVLERWEKAGVQTIALPQDLAHLSPVGDHLLSARERLKNPRTQETLQAFYERAAKVTRDTTGQCPCGFTTTGQIPVACPKCKAWKSVVDLRAPEPQPTRTLTQTLVWVRDHRTTTEHINRNGNKKRTFGSLLRHGLIAWSRTAGWEGTVGITDKGKTYLRKNGIR